MTWMKSAETMTSLPFDKSEHFDKNALILELRQAGSVQRGNSYSCPFHDDRNPSGSIKQGSDGVWRFKCFTPSCDFYGDIFDVRAKRKGVDLPEIFREGAEPFVRNMMETPKGVERMTRVYNSLEDIVNELKYKGEVQNIYRYHGGVDFAEKFAVIRYIPFEDKKRKVFSQAVKVSNGWMRKGPPKPMPLYNLESVTRAKSVIVVEGEKCVEALRDCGHIATTSAGGSGPPGDSYWGTLSGKTVYLWPDNDESGYGYRDKVMSIFRELENPPTVYLIDPVSIGLGEKGDVADYLKEHADKSISERHTLIQSILNQAEPTDHISRVKKQINLEVSGERQAIRWPWDILSHYTRALLPGTTTLICGTPGSAKSFFLLASMIHWHSQNIPVTVMELEEDQTYHLRRVAAMLRGRSEMLNPEWSKENPMDALDEWSEVEPFIDGFGPSIHEALNPSMKYAELLGWLDRQVKNGERIVAVDPISALDTGDKNSWNEDKKFLSGVRDIISKSNTSLILITHPRGGKYSFSDLENIQGGSAFVRFTQTVIWIETRPEKKAVEVRTTTDIMRTVMANRIIKILKTRNSNGEGIRIAYDFCNHSLNFTELGIIAKKEKRGGDEE